MSGLDDQWPVCTKHATFEDKYSYDVVMSAISVMSLTDTYTPTFRS